MTAFHLLGNRVERQIQFVEHMKISVCRTYSKLAKTAYKSVGGLYSCSDIFDFELSFLG